MKYYLLNSKERKICEKKPKFHRAGNNIPTVVYVTVVSSGKYGEELNNIKY